MDLLTPPVSILNAQFRTFEELCEAPLAWDVEFIQTEPGLIDLSAVFGISSRFQFGHCLFNKKHLEQGSSTKGFRTFIVTAGPQADYASHRQPVSHNQILLLPASNDIDNVACGGFNVFSLSIHVEDMEQLEVMTDGLNISDTSTSGTLFTPKPHALERLRRVLWSISQLGATDELSFRFEAASQAAQSALASCLATTVRHKDLPPLQKRDKALDKAIQYINENLQSIYTIKDLCAAANVSERTLLSVFKERLDVTPKAYLQMFKLKKVQQELIFKTSRNITDAATKWGFWHMSQFAMDYRLHFGELPSETLKRTSF